MAAPKRSFGYTLILADRPDLKFDLEQLPKKLRKTGSLDDIALELEVQGSGNATSIRTNALRTLADQFRREENDARSIAYWLPTKDLRMAAWSGCACARDTLRFIADKQEFTKLISIMDGWLSGTVSDGERQDAIAAARLAGDDDDLIRSSAMQACIYAADFEDNRGYAVSCAADVGALRSGDEDWQAARDAELLRLVTVISDALPGMPVRVR